MLLVIDEVLMYQVEINMYCTYVSDKYDPSKTVLDGLIFLVK